MKSSLGDKPRLQHIYDAVLEIENYIAESTYESFQSNSMMQYASVKQLEIIGEAANHLSQHFKKLYSKIQWREIVDLRNLLIHESKIVWDIITIDLALLKSPNKRNSATIMTFQTLFVKLAENILLFNFN